VSPTSTSDRVEARTPATAGVFPLLGRFALDLGLYLALLAIFGIGAVAAAYTFGEARPRYTGPHWVALTLQPCVEHAGRDEALLSVLRRHGELTAEIRSDGRPLPMRLVGGVGPEGQSSQQFMAMIEPPPGIALELSSTAIAQATGCRVEKLVYAPAGERSPDRLVLPPAFVAAALLASLAAAALAWVWRRPERGLALSRGGAGAAVATALLAAVAAQAVPRLMAAVGAPLSPSNAGGIQDLVLAWPLLASVLVVLAAPLAEEGFFRGVLLRRFLLAGRPVLGLLLTSGLFAFAHEAFADGPWTQTLATTGVYAVVGLLFGTVYLRTGRLWAAALAHAASNGLALAAMAYSAA